MHKEKIKQLYRDSSYQKVNDDHLKYLVGLKDSDFEPSVIYDIGACVGAWYREVKNIWPKSKFLLFDGWEPAQELYKDLNVDYFIGLLGNKQKEVKFYFNDRKPGGNSFLEPDNKYTGEKYVNFQSRMVTTLDDVVENKKFPLPDLIKIDTQGAELEVLEGAINTIKNAEYIILEVKNENIDYGENLPSESEIVKFLNKNNFEKVQDLGYTTHKQLDKDIVFKRRK